MGGLSAILREISRNEMTRYGTALAATVAALVLRLALRPVLGDSLPYVTILPAVALAAWLCGVGPSVLAIVVGLAGAWYWFVGPEHAQGVSGAQEVAGMVAFVAAAAAIVAIGEMSRRNNETLRRAQDDLEERVRQRTAELDGANQSLRELTARLLKSQDEERRRIARELHDSVGQTLAALAMNLSTVGADIERLLKTAGTVADSAALVDDMSTDIRTISYLLHPPLLDEAGLSSALRWYVEGFAERSKIRVELDVPDDLGRLPRDLETSIFRVVQECLTNIHRHSGSPVATVRVAHNGAEVRIEVADEGKGIPAEKQQEILASGLPGVGLRGMRERVRQLGGSLEIRSGDGGKGTVVLARLPVAGGSAESAPTAWAAGHGN